MSGLGRQPELQKLAEDLQSNIDPMMWMSVGGACYARPLGDDRLLVHAYQRSHQKIDDYLEARGASLVASDDPAY